MGQPSADRRQIKLEKVFWTSMRSFYS